MILSRVYTLIRSCSPRLDDLVFLEVERNVSIQHSSKAHHVLPRGVKSLPPAVVQTFYRYRLMSHSTCPNALISIGNENENVFRHRRLEYDGMRQKKSGVLSQDSISHRVTGIHRVVMSQTKISRKCFLAAALALLCLLPVVAASPVRNGRIRRLSAPARSDIDTHFLFLCCLTARYHSCLLGSSYWNRASHPCCLSLFPFCWFDRLGWR